MAGDLIAGKTRSSNLVEWRVLLETSQSLSCSGEGYQCPVQTRESLLGHLHASDPIRKCKLFRKTPVSDLTIQSIQHSCNKRVPSPNWTDPDQHTFTPFRSLNSLDNPEILRRISRQMCELSGPWIQSTGSILAPSATKQ